MGNVTPIRKRLEENEQTPATTPTTPAVDLVENFETRCDEMVEMGLAYKTVDGGYGMTPKGRLAAGILISMALLAAKEGEVDVSDTVVLHAFVLGAL